MYAITVGNNTLKRYKLQWHSYNGKRYYNAKGVLRQGRVKKTRILHSISLQNVKSKAIQLFGNVPDNVQRV